MLRMTNTPTPEQPPAEPAAVTVQYLTIAECAAQLRVSTMTVRRWIEAGDLVAVKHNRTHRVDQAELQAFVQRSTSTRRESTPLVTRPGQAPKAEL